MLRELSYFKMTGSGNDFIIVNNFDKKINVEEIRKIVPKLCARGLSIGADGLFVIEPCDKADFMWHFYNADGSEAKMCGNGSRCAARFAYLNNFAGKNMTFLTGAGIIRAEIQEGVNVKVQLTKPEGLLIDKPFDAAGYKSYNFLNTGVPHVVIFEDSICEADVYSIGKLIRYHSEFSPDGANVNLAKIKDGELMVRTYERGVENETLACGTGATACALVSIEKGLLKSPATVITSGGGKLKIYKEGDRVYLEGEARLLSKGTITEEAYNY